MQLATRAGLLFALIASPLAAHAAQVNVPKGSAVTSIPKAGSGVPAKDRTANDTARRLSVLALSVEKYRAMLVEVSNQIATTLESRTGGVKFGSGFSANLRVELERAVPYDELVNVQADVYSRSYSTDELMELERFFKTPVGRRYVDVGPEVARALQTTFQDRVERKLTDVMKKAASGPEQK